MYNHKESIPYSQDPTFENVKNEDKFNDSVMDYQNGAVSSNRSNYDYSMVIPLDQVPYRPHDE